MHIKINSCGGVASVELNGKEISGQLLGYTVAHEAGKPCVVDLHYRLWPDEVEIEGQGAECKADSV